ncbi:methyltransferase family protein [Chitinophaga skermanii]|uniref:Methyltransferase family protein n=1 Tax=Chitinophaga skermanii TaxID=331697 RepID=A0A327QPU7_9BACT|nr:class I SAM-dependent methyltransferase [Chitinophaga skermanii]RAJ05373.1 methyltransferase family protein [Chitinophaga skermanii]
MATNAYQRAAMPRGTNAVLDVRTVDNANANLLLVLKPGMRVLDVGCGSGTITKGIADIVGPNGYVCGIDRSKELIDIAQRNFKDYANLEFVSDDVMAFKPTLPFDVITTSRTLQWIETPQEVMKKMISILVPGGMICVLDYNHTKIEWQPAPPASMQYFYNQFLKWRADVGMNNAIGDALPQLVTGLHMQLQLHAAFPESTKREDPDFQTHISIWTKVAETRGQQLVADGYISEQERLQAIKDYNEYCINEAQTMRMYLMATHASV